MKLRILSDLHIEYFPFEVPALDDDGRTILILAGDIGNLADAPPLLAFLDRAATRFRAVCYVMGNHEYYDEVWPTARRRLEGRLAPNVHILERQTVVIDDVTFAGATLWTDFFRHDAASMDSAARRVPDFSVIAAQDMPEGSGRPLRFHPQLAYEDHVGSRQWIAGTLAALHEQGRKAVLITHHAVSPQSIHPDFADHPANAAFISDLRPILMETRPILAVHGHVHNSFDYLVEGPGSTRVLANPRGYARRPDTQENKAFNPELVVEI